jgi:hypothetical protein
MAGGVNRQPGRARRRVAWGALVLGVLAAHGCVTQALVERMAELNAAPNVPARLEVVYVRDMTAAAVAPAAPAAPAAAAAPPMASPPSPRKARKASRPASAPEPAASEPASALALAPVPEPPRAPELATAPEPAPDPPPLPEAAPASAPASEPAAEPPRTARAGPAVAAGPAAAAVAAGSAASAPDANATPFDWPVSTRVSYRLTGNVRGEVNGSAEVEWVRVGNRYQVHLDVTVGLSFAPLMTRRMSSDGEITPQGLVPRRYDQDTKIGFGNRQRVAVLFEPDVVVLADGQRRERWPGVQDTASQFIQLTYLFGTRPELLQPGGALEMPLALPRNVSRWIYDVVGEETVYTPIGPIAAHHLKPRRAVVKGGDLSAETWFAPAWRYLPVRIRIQQDAETFIDLVIDRKPQLAAG